MSYLEGEGTLLGVNMKKGGKMILQIEVGGELASKEDYYHLRKMIERNIKFALDSLVVSYNVEINARTEKPIRSYRVDAEGIVSEIKPEGEQLELDMGMPKPKDPTTEVPTEIDRVIVDEFIMSLLAPNYDDMPYPFYAFTARLLDGDTYSKLASEYGISSGKIVEIMDEYRQRVAPLAQKWDEWRKSKVVGLDDKHVENKNPIEDKEPLEKVEGRTIEFEDGETGGNSSETDQPGNLSNTIHGKEELENFIISGQAPTYEDIPYDFAALMKRKRDGESWMEISVSLKISSSKLSTALNEYKKRVKAHLEGGEEHGAA